MSWDAEKSSIVTEHYNTDALYHSYGRNRKLCFSDAVSQTRTVCFKGKSGGTIKTYVVQPGNYAAVAPTDAEMPDYGANWVFVGWDKAFDNVRNLELTVNAVYHKLCTVTFVGGVGGQTQLDQQTVEQTRAATAPTAPVVPGYVFVNWDTDFSNIADDAVVTAVYVRTYQVVFKDAGGTALDTQTIRTSFSATAPNMTGREYQGLPFFGWESDFSNVTSDLEVVAYCGLRPKLAKHFAVWIPANYSQGSCSTYPLLVRVSEAGFAGFGCSDFLRNGQDIYVEDANGNQLPVELVQWNPAGESLFYVRVTSALGGSDVTVSYGAAMTFDQPAGVWPGYAGVWHFEEAEGDAADSAGHGLSATPRGTPAQIVASTDGAIGRSRVDATDTGTANGMGVAASINNFISDASVFTVEGWFEATGVNGYTRVFSRKNSYSDGKSYEVEYNSGSKTNGKVTGKGASPRLEFVSVDTTAGWQKLTYVFDSATASMYTNGALSATGSVTAVEAATVGFSVGNDADFNERRWWGMYDEVKVYNGAKGATQVAFEYTLDTGSLVCGAATSTGTSAPDLAAVSITSADGKSMTVSLGIVSFGDSAESASAYIAYGADTEHLCAPVEFAEGDTSPVSGAITGLASCAAYVYTVYVENGLGVASEAKTGSFHVSATTTPVANKLSYAGLLQGKLNTANDFVADIRANSVIPLEVVPGVVVAQYKVGSYEQNVYFCTGPYTGREFEWNESNTAFGYFGEIYLPVGDLHVSKNVDDSAYVKIGNTVVINDAAYTEYPVGTFTVTTAGWYPVEVHIGGGAGGKGVADTAKFENNGIAYNVDGTTNPSSARWAPLMDTTGALLRYADTTATYLSMGPVTDAADGTVSAWISVDDGVPTPATLVAFYGAEDHGESTTWNNRIVLAELAQGESLVSTRFDLPNLAKCGAVRFALLGEATATGPAFAQFSNLYEYEQIIPLVALQLGEIVEEGVSVTIPVENLGVGAASATVRLEYSLTSDFADSGFIAVGNYTAPEVVDFDITTLAPATTYFVRAVIENSEGETNVSEVIQFTTYNSAIAHVGETLVWIGGASGTWDTTTANWTSPKGYQVTWLDGCKASFTNDASIALSGERTAIGIESASNVTFSGAAITLAAPATITHAAACVIRFENDVKGADGVVLENDCEPDFIPLGEMNAVKIFDNIALSDIDFSLARTIIHYSRSGAAERIVSGGVIADNTTATGINFFKRGDGWISFECRTQLGDWWNNPYIAKVVLKQVGADVYGYVEKAQALESIAAYSSIEVTGGTHHTIALETSAIASVDNPSDHRMGVEKIILTDRDPVYNAATEFAGDYQVVGEIAVNAGVFKVVGEGTMFGGNFTQSGSSVTTPVVLANDGKFMFDSSAAQTFAMMVNARNSGSGYTGIKTCITAGRFVIGPNATNVTMKCTSEGMHRIFNAIDIYGTVTMAQGTYHIVYDNPYGIFVRDGGVLNMNLCLGGYGLRNAIVTCEAGGVINFTDVWSMGSGGSGQPLTIDGGTAHITKDYTSNMGDDIKHSYLVLKDGAVIDGVMMSWARGENTLVVSGTTPSTVSLQKIRMGQNGKTASSGTKLYETMDVADVTGDADPDLVVSSELYAHPNASGTGANAKYFGIVKKGAGTVEFTGTSTNYNAAITLQAGTVSFASTAKLNGTALNVEGDSFLEVAEGAEIVFSDNVDTAWTADKTLTIKGNLPSHGIRFGTDANGLTAAQLSQIKKEGSNASAWLNSTGYLRIGITHTIMMFR